MLTGCVPWPQESAVRYRREGYWQGELLGDLLRHPAQAGDTALVTEDASWRYSELDEWASRLAAGLRRLGIRSRDRVVVQLPNVPEFVVVSVALFRLGALPVFAPPALRRSEIFSLCQLTGAVAYLIPGRYQGFDYRELAAAVARTVPGVRHVLSMEPGEFPSLAEVTAAQPERFEPPDPGEVAFFLLSGGTTGVPKLIPRTHDDYAYQLRATAEATGMDRHGAYLAALPAAHNAALGCPGILGTLRAGGKVVLAATPSPDEVFPLMKREGVTLTTLMPSLLMVWLEAAEFSGTDLSGVVVEVGGAMLSPDVARRVRPVLGCTITQWFAMAEGLLCFTRPDDPERVATTTQGRPLSPADEIRVVGDDGTDVPPGAVGELLTRGPYTIRGYYRAAEHNARVFTRDGFYRTGDLVRITGTGELVAEGRVKDIVNRGGEKVSAAEVEDQLLAHPGVRDAAVIAVPDPAMGEKTCAVIVPAAGPVGLSQLGEFLRARGMADYKLPDRVEVVDALPYTGVGKVNKAALRAEFGGAA